MMGSLFLILSAIAPLADARQLPPAKSDLAGIYALAGTEGDEPYVGATIISKSGAAYIVMSSAVVGDGKTFQTRGVGFVEDGVLTVGWTAGGQTGVTRYAIKGGTLTGRYVNIPGDGLIREETLTLKSKLPKEG